jgi:acetyl-CoA synthetase (ADP-forming)
MVVLGAGGTGVELLKDVQMLPAPISKAQAMAMIRQLRCLPLLQGWRGKTPADLAQLADLVVAVSDLAINTEGLAELDINPLMLVDGQFWGADARAVMRD